MKVIKNGKEKTFITRCSSCGSDLEYTLEDVNKKKVEFGEINYVTCPVCSKELYALLVVEGESPRNDPHIYACSQY